MSPRTSIKKVLRDSYYDRHKISDEQIEAYAKPLRAPGGKYALLQTARQAIPENVKEITDQYPTITVPTLILWGLDDRLIPIKIGRMLHEAIPRSTLEKSIRNSLSFGVFHGSKQVGFARVISDSATVAYLGDVFVVPEYRGRGLAKWLMQCVVSHSDLQNLRRWILVTENAHGLYRKYGFTQLARPDRFMELHTPDVYMRASRDEDR